MKDEFKSRIIQHLDDLAQNTTNLVQLLTTLLSKSVLAEVEYQTIECNETEYKKNTKLYLALMKKDDKAFHILLESLRSTGNERLANLLELKSPIKPDNEKTWFDIHSTNFCVGRDNEIDMIDKYWEECFVTKRLTFVAISGLGGIGKSEIAKSYAKKFYEEVGGSCIWINAETIFSQLESIRKLAKELEISVADGAGNEKGLQNLVMEIYAKLGGTKWLVILDNMELPRDECNSKKSKKSILKHFVSSSIRPPSELRPLVLITSRHRPTYKILGYTVEHIPLEVLHEDAAVELIAKSLHADISNTDVSTQLKSICKRLEYFPLALQQAVAFIEEQKGYSSTENAIQMYTGLINREGEAMRLLNHPIDDHNGISQTTYLTWKITLKKIKNIPQWGSSAIEILNIISFLCPDNISSKFLNKLTQNQATKDVLKILHHYSICRLLPKETEDLIFIHRLVQEVIRTDLEEKNKLEGTLDNLLTLIHQKLKARELSLGEMSHVTSIWEHTRKHPKLIEKHQELPDAISMKFYSSGCYGEAFEFSCDALEMMTSTLGENNRWTIWMLGWQGVIFHEKGQYEESYNLMTDIYEKQKQLLGDDDEHTLYSANSIGLTLSGQKQYKQAMDWFTYALDKRINRYGREHQATLTLQNNIANVLDEEGKYDEAFAMYQEVLAARDKKMGKDHPSTLNTKHNIGVIKYRQKKFEEAHCLFQEVLEIRKKVQEVDHPDILRAKYWIMRTLKGLGMHEKALEMEKEVFEKTTNIFGSKKVQ